MATKRLKHRYVQWFGIMVMVLAVVRCVFPGIATHRAATGASSLEPSADSVTTPVVTQQEPTATSDTDTATKPTEKQVVKLHSAQCPHPILSVHDYDEAFPDSNHVQLVAAQQWGVPPVKNRADAELRQGEVVYMGLSPYYDVARLDASIPYLVPRAAILLHDIGRNFFDSLQVKGLPLHRIVVSSVLRSEDDVKRLRLSNKNATEQSCHLYGTTFDINYNTYAAVSAQRTVGDDKLKYVLSEVLRDLRQQGRCYIKYEKRQPCFHITVR